MKQYIRSTIAIATLSSALMATSAANAQLFSLTVNAFSTDEVTGSIVYNSATQTFSNANFTYNFTTGGVDYVSNLDVINNGTPIPTGMDVRTIGTTSVTSDSRLFFDFFAPPATLSLTSGTDLTGISYLFALDPRALPLTYSETGTVGFSVAAIPEPQTYALFLAGLGLLGFASRRKA